MNSEKTTVTNMYGEKLDTLLEGKREAAECIVFVHGFGTDKDEGFASFIDLSNAFKGNYFILRYDISGYGQSEGAAHEFNFHKATGDLESILRWVSRNHPDKKINIIAHSLGTFITALHSPSGINKIIFTAIPNANTSHIIDGLQKRISSKEGGEVNENGLTTYPRTRGGAQLIGKDFWRTLRAFEPAPALEELANKCSLILFHPKQDDVLDDLYFEAYQEIKELEYVELDGDHNFTRLEDRAALIEAISNFLQK